MTTGLVLAIVPALMSGGLVGAIMSFHSARKKLPVEIDSIIVTGAEAAVASLARSLEAETRRADRAELENRRLECQIEGLRSRLDLLQTSLDLAREEIATILHAKN